MNKKEAYMCAEVSQLAYGGDAKIDNFQLSAKFENKGTDTQGIFGVANGDSLVIAFRGSEETGPEDWITDIKFLKQVFPYGDSKNKKVKVHFGFIQAYKSVRDAILEEARKSSHKRIIVTGHSLGGALATLCALDVQYNLPEKEVFSYTFGSPRVGNNDFAASYNRRVPESYRFINGSDVIPKLPIGGYKHVGEVCKVGDIQSVSTEVVDRLEDHFPNRYIKAIRDWLG